MEGMVRLQAPSIGPTKSLAILGYHKIGEPGPDAWDTWFYLPEEAFVDDLRRLQESGWDVVDGAAVVRAIEDPTPLPQRAVLITFDDGYRSVLTVALPWLRRFGFPAVVFVPTEFVGGSNDFDDGAEPPEQLCDWNELRELRRHGVSIQSHCASHRALSELGPTEWEDEFRRSRSALAEQVGAAVDMLAYPYGDNAGGDPQLERALRHAGYRAACLYASAGVNDVPIENAYRLKRFAMGPGENLADMLRAEGAGVSA